MVIKLLYLTHDQEKSYKLYCDYGGGNDMKGCSKFRKALRIVHSKTLDMTKGH
jgi:hypothetical protein